VWLHRDGIGNESLHETENDNGVWEVIFCQIQKPVDLHTLGLMLMGRLIDISHFDRWEIAFKYT
jgi:hypothetical protein